MTGAYEKNNKDNNEISLKSLPDFRIIDNTPTTSDVPTARLNAKLK